MFVNLEARYNAAWSEVNTRLQLRQNAITVYATLMSFVVAGMGLSTQPLSKWVVFLVPVFSLLFAIQAFMHDKIICNLCKFIRECESRVNMAAPTPPLPGYLSDAKWASHDDNIRRLHHVFCASMILVFNGLAGYAAKESRPDLFTMNSMVMWLLIGLVIVALGFVIWTIRTDK